MSDYLFVLDKTDSPFFKNRDDWSDFIYSVRNEKGKLASARGLSENNLDKVIDYNKGSIFIYLPEGSWYIEIFKDWDDFDKHKFLVRSDKFFVKKDNASLPVKLILDKDK